MKQSTLISLALLGIVLQDVGKMETGQWKQDNEQRAMKTKQWKQDNGSKTTRNDYQNMTMDGNKSKKKTMDTRPRKKTMERRPWKNDHGKKTMETRP